MKNKILSEVKVLAEQLLSEEVLQSTTGIKNKVSKLYERLCVLEYLENSISDVTLEGETEIETEQSLDSKSYRENTWFTEPKPVPPSNYTEELAEPVIEKIKDLVAQIPEDSQKVDMLLEELLPKAKMAKNELETFAENYQEMPVFERKENGKPKEINNNPQVENFENKTINKTIAQEDKPKSVNDAVGKDISIGLNDRIAFIKHLFNGSASDYTRVLSQINTLSSIDEVEYFIKVKVKPDYNYWLHKEEYADRFMSYIERKF